MGHTLAASIVSTFASFIFSLIFVLKMDTWRAPGAPWEAHGVPFGGPRARLKPLFRENGEHEFCVVFTVFAPHYGLQGAPMLAPKMTTEVKSEHNSVGECKTGRHQTHVHQNNRKSSKKGSTTPRCQGSFWSQKVSLKPLFVKMVNTSFVWYLLYLHHIMATRWGPFEHLGRSCVPRAFLRAPHLFTT